MDIINQLQKPKFRIKHNKNLSTKQKRVIRKTFNKIQSHITKTVDEHMLNVIAYGNSN